VTVAYSKDPLQIRSREASLTQLIGDDFSLPGMAGAMLGSERAWKAAVSFCETIIS
jgi:hypothetical protein